MMLSLVALMMPKPLAFPDEPIAAELARGESVYYLGKGLDRVVQEDRRAIGKWFDGSIQRDIDDVIWLSPSLVSRWLGYLNAREKWSARELGGRWKELAHKLDKKLTFVVELAALPKQEDLLELGEETPAKAIDATLVRFEVTTPTLYGGPATLHWEAREFYKLLDSSVQTLGVFKAYDWERLFKTPWYTLTPEFGALLPEFAHPCSISPYDYVIGDHTLAVYLVQSPLPDSSVLGSTIDVHVFTRTKQRNASFSLLLEPK